MEKRRLVSCKYVAIVVALSLAPLSGHIVYAKTFRLTIGAGSPLTAPWMAVSKDFFAYEVKKRVEATTNDKIEWVYAYGGTVAKIGGVLDAVKDGILDLGVMNYAFEPTKLFLHNFSMVTPFTSNDVFTHARAATKTYEGVPYLKEAFEKNYNQIYLGCSVCNSYQMVTTFPCKTLADLKGKKIAAAGPNLPWIKGTGAVPVQSNLNEAYTSLQSGVYDGWIMYVDTIASFKLHEVARHLILVDLGGAISAGLTINKDTWKSLPKEIQEIMRKAGVEYTMEVAKASKVKEGEGFEIMKKAGAVITRFSEEQRLAWANMLPELPNQRAQEANKKGMPGSQVFRVWFGEMEKDGYKFIRKWKID